MNNSTIGNGDTIYCPICGSLNSKFVSILYDDRYGYPGQFYLMRCLDCKHAFLDCALSPNQLTMLYTNYYPRKSFDIEHYTPYVEENGLSAWLNGLESSAFRWVPENVSVLDIGCGFGESLGYHAARGCYVYGVEADENISRVVEKFGYNVKIGLFDDKVYEASFFDYVTMDQVIEHVTDPLSTLQGVARILKSGGTAILTTPNASGWGAKFFGSRWINWHTPYHLQFFSKNSIKLVADHAGLEVVKIKTVTNSEWLYFQWLHLITFSKLGEVSGFWSPTKVKLTFLQKAFIKILSLIHKTKANHVITRIFDSIGLGDNFVIVLKKP